MLVIVNTSSNAEYTVPLPYPGKWLTQFEDDPSPAEEQSLVIAPRQAYILRKEGTN